MNHTLPQWFRSEFSHFHTNKTVGRRNVRAITLLINFSIVNSIECLNKAALAVLIWRSIWAHYFDFPHFIDDNNSKFTHNSKRHRKKCMPDDLTFVLYEVYFSNFNPSPTLFIQFYPKNNHQMHTRVIEQFTLFVQKKNCSTKSTKLHVGQSVVKYRLFAFTCRLYLLIDMEMNVFLTLDNLIENNWFRILLTSKCWNTDSFVIV